MLLKKIGEMGESCVTEPEKAGGCSEFPCLRQRQGKSEMEELAWAENEGKT